MFFWAIETWDCLFLLSYKGLRDKDSFLVPSIWLISFESGRRMKI